jgi:hypothetical protein
MMARHRGQTAQGGPFRRSERGQPRRGRQAFCHWRGRCDSAPGTLDRDAAMTDRTRCPTCFGGSDASERNAATEICRVASDYPQLAGN